MARVVFDPENEQRHRVSFPRLDMRSEALRKKQERSAEKLRRAEYARAAEVDRKYRDARIAAAIVKAAEARDARKRNTEAMFQQVIQESAVELERLIRSRVYNKQTRRVAIIQKRAVRLFRVTLEQLNGPERTRHVADARQFVAYWASRLTGLSQPQIGKLIGRDHTTVLHGCKAYREKRAAMKRNLRPAR